MILKDDTEKWMAIEHHALQSLRDAGYKWRGTGALSQVFRFLIVPSFSTATAYSFSVRSEALDGTRYYCVRTKWDRQYDRERFESSLRTKADLKPTLDRTLVKLSDDFARSILEQTQDMSVPIFAERGIQIDGTHYEFSTVHAALKWGENAPEEWRHLAEIALKYVQHVDELAKESDSEDI